MYIYISTDMCCLILIVLTQGLDLDAQRNNNDIQQENMNAYIAKFPSASLQSNIAISFGYRRGCYKAIQKHQHVWDTPIIKSIIISLQ